MAYRLKHGETVPEAIRRIVQEEIDSAGKQLTNGQGKKRDEAVHEARKSLKKVRGALRLMQPELGRAYQDENTRMRDLGRELSEIRDATAIIEVFDSLVEKHASSLQKDAFGAIRRGLEKSKRETEQAAGIEKVIQQAQATLRATGKRVKNWPLKADGFQAIAPGFENRYRRGRRAMAIAEKDPSPENYHEWRKRVKDHWYHVRLLESLWTEAMQSRESSLKDLETWLGDDHNLVVLRQKLEDNPEQYGDQKEIKLFMALMDQHQKELRENAVSLGQRLYEQKPKQLVRDFAKLWDAWQSEPAGMKEVEKTQRKAAKKESAPATDVKAKKATAA